MNVKSSVIYSIIACLESSTYDLEPLLIIFFCLPNIFLIIFLDPPSIHKSEKIIMDEAPPPG